MKALRARSLAGSFQHEKREEAAVGMWHIRMKTTKNTNKSGDLVATTFQPYWSKISTNVVKHEGEM